MLYCIEVERGGIGEENVTLHHRFDKEPTREEIIELIEDEDIGYDDDYCDFDFYQVD
jgi:hypothetical protein